MSLTHIHLLLNHVPTVGSIIALAVLLVGFSRRDEHLKHVGLEILFVIALLTLPVYVSGAGAHLELGKTEGLSDHAIRVHQDAAIWGFAAVELAGFLAWIALWQVRRTGRPSPGLVPGTILVLFVTLALMGRAANLGGEIRHPEMHGALAADAVAAEPEPEGRNRQDSRYLASRISWNMVNSRWIWPAAEAVHFLGLALTIGVLLAVNLRILGVMPRVAFSDVHRLLPWGMLAFGANLITGMLFFIGVPYQYVQGGPFYWKVVLLMIAGANFLYLTVYSKPWTAQTLDASLADKAMAVSSLAAWLGVLYAGRMLPFLGNAF